MIRRLFSESKGTAFSLFEFQAEKKNAFSARREQAYTALTASMLQERDTVDKQTRDAVKLSYSAYKLAH